MAAIEMNVSSTVCRKCGTAYTRLKGFFPVSYSSLYKGVGYLPYCRECVDAMYEEYYSECKDRAMACRQVCRALNIYWSGELFAQTERNTSTRSLMTVYITKTNGTKFLGKSYDDTLREENALWSNITSYKYDKTLKEEQRKQEEIEAPILVTAPEVNEYDLSDVPEEYIRFWGDGYPASFYEKAQKKYEEWTTGRADLQMSEITLFKQICLLEVTIDRDNAAGKPIDKNVTTLQNVLGNMNLKPVQMKDSVDTQTSNTPFGVWIKRWEDQRPVPEIDDDMKDVDGIIKYINIWLYGHLAHMLGIKNCHSKLYEEEMERLRVERPEYSDEDDESFIQDIFGGAGLESGDEDEVEE